MREKVVIDSLNVIRDELRSILDREAQAILAAAVAEIRTSRATYDATRRHSHSDSKPQNWGYALTNPLEFKPENCNGHKLRVDVNAKIRWEDADTPTEQDVCVRVWAEEQKLFFRPEWDAQRVSDHLMAIQETKRRRVLFRCHFDLANPATPNRPAQPGPKHHLQIGGNGDLSELCWFPDSIKIPRFAHPPMDLLLVCQMVAANFFPSQYRNIKSSTTWRRRVKDSEEIIWKEYYDTCQSYFTSNAHTQVTLLDHLWNN